MRKHLLKVGVVLFLLGPIPALAQCDPARQQCRNTYATLYSQSNDVAVDPRVARIAALIVIVVVASVAFASTLGSSDKQPAPSPEEYDQQAARTRACARKLDADAALAESQLRASLKQDELQEFQTFMRDKNSRRRK